jgi:hypothetical protein
MACDFKLSTIKPHTLDFLYVGYKVVADQPDMITRGWDACGLLTPYKEELKDEAYAKALAAMSDPEHPYYPLFPSNDRTQPPPNGEEPTPGAVEAGSDSTALLDGDQDMQCITERAEAVMMLQDKPDPRGAPAKRKCAEQPDKLYPMFAKRSKAS